MFINKLNKLFADQYTSPEEWGFGNDLIEKIAFYLTPVAVFTGLVLLMGAVFMIAS